MTEGEHMTGTVYGIRPHRPMTPAEHDLARRVAEEQQITPEAVRELLATLNSRPGS